MHGPRIYAQVRTLEPHRPSLLLQARDSGRVGRTCLRGECECNGNATVVLPVSNERRRKELPFPLLMFSPPATGSGRNKCKCSRSRPRESRKSRVHTFLISRSRNLEAEKHAKTSCGYAAAPFCAGYETKERDTQKTCPARSLQPKLPLVIAQVCLLWSPATLMVLVD